MSQINKRSEFLFTTIAKGILMSSNRVIAFATTMAIWGTVCAQSFTNSDLNGVITGPFSLPFSWQNVPYTDPHCYATSPTYATPDLTDLNGPDSMFGLCGQPYSGSTFVCGLLGGNGGLHLHEGIMQTVNGFTSGCTYTIRFYQAVVKQENGLDTSGSWAIYIDNTLAGITTPSVSQAYYNSVNLTWELRTITFTASASSHTVKFLPKDDDLDTILSYWNQAGALRMGIDSIGISERLNVDIGNDTTLCPGQTVTLNANLNTPGMTYTWQDGSTGPNYVVSKAGTYWVHVSNGCISASDTVMINYFPDSNDLDLGEDTILCQGQILKLEVSIPNANYLWQDGSTSPSFTITMSGSYWVEVSTVCGVYRDSIFVQFISGLPSLDLGNDTVLCEGDTLSLDATYPGGSYQWQDGAITPTYQVDQSGIYWVMVTNVCGTSSDTITVDYRNEKITVDLGKDTTLCEGDSLVLGPPGQNGDYLWQDGSKSNNFVVTLPGIYWLKINTLCGTGADTLEVTYHETPTVDLGNDTVLCLGETLLLEADQPNVDYLWQDNSRQPNYMVATLGTYWVEISNVCDTAYSSIDIGYEDCGCLITMPTAFSPNGDGQNDRLYPIYNCTFNYYELRIFDRWGQLVFRTGDPMEYWDGSINGEPAPIEVYIYILKYQFEHSKLHKIESHNVTLLR